MKEFFVLNVRTIFLLMKLNIAKASHWFLYVNTVVSNSVFVWGRVR